MGWVGVAFFHGGGPRLRKKSETKLSHQKGTRAKQSVNWIIYGLHIAVKVVCLFISNSRPIIREKPPHAGAGLIIINNAIMTTTGAKKMRKIQLNLSHLVVPVESTKII